MGLRLMAKCSKKYLDLVRTRTGLTPEKPWTSILGINLPSMFEYEEWKSLAEELTEAAHRQFVYLGDLEARTSDGTHHPHWNRLLGESQIVQQQTEALPSALLSAFDPTEMSWKEDVEQAITASVDAACLLEKVDEAIDSYGVPVPSPGVTPKAPAQKPDRDGIGVLGMIGVLALAGAGVYGVIRYTRKEDKVE